MIPGANRRQPGRYRRNPRAGRPGGAEARPLAAGRAGPVGGVNPVGSVGSKGVDRVARQSLNAVPRARPESRALFKTQKGGNHEQLQVGRTGGRAEYPGVRV